MAHEAERHVQHPAESKGWESEPILGESKGLRNNRQFWLQTLNLTMEQLKDLGHLTETELANLDLSKRNRALFKKLKALVELVRHCP